VERAKGIGGRGKTIRLAPYYHFAEAADLVRYPLIFSSRRAVVMGIDQGFDRDDQTHADKWL
jgi:hypothetical protein